MTKLKMKHIFLLFFILSINFIQCEFLNDKPITIGTNLWIGYEPLYVARHKGLLKETEFKLIQFPSTEEVMRAYRNGVLDIAAVTTDEMLQVAKHIPQTRTFLITDISNGADVIMAHADINSVKELKGKKVGLEAGALGVFVLSRALMLNGLKSTDVKPVNVSLKEHVKFYHDSLVDAVVTFEPNRTILKNMGANEVFSSREIPGEIIDLLIGREAFLKKHQKKMKRFINIWFESLEYLNNQDSIVLEFISKRHGVKCREIKNALADIKIPNRKENYEYFNRPQDFRRNLDIINKVLFEADLISAGEVPNNLLYSHLLK